MHETLRPESSNISKMVTADKILGFLQTLPDHGQGLLQNLRNEINSRLAEKDEFGVVAATAISTVTLFLGINYTVNCIIQ